jgi:ABC-type uncharacterized transport system permease subunit
MAKAFDVGDLHVWNLVLFTVAAAVALAFISRRFFRFALQKYRSASS